MTAPTHEQIARTATAWWVEQIRSKPAQRMTRQGDSVTDFMLNLQTQGTPAASEEALEYFQATLEGIVLAGLAGLDDEQDDFHLHCDYEPQGPLSVASEAARINPKLFPIKTHMWVYAGKIEVCLGYGAAVEELPITE